MTGEMLYKMYQKFHLDDGCGTDNWDSLGDRERGVWTKLADWITSTE